MLRRRSIRVTNGRTYPLELGWAQFGGTIHRHGDVDGSMSNLSIDGGAGISDINVDKTGAGGWSTRREIP